jgi:hypothetical protein
MFKYRKIVFKLGLDLTLEQQGVVRTTSEKGALCFLFPSYRFHV